MQDYLKKNPPVNEDMLRSMMMSMGQKPSEKKIRQMMQQMKNKNRFLAQKRADPISSLLLRVTAIDRVSEAEQMRRNTYSVLRVTVIDRVSEACKFILVIFARRTVSEAERR